MKKIFTLILTFLCATALFAQTPEKFTYQAVMRNATNALIANASVSIRVSILQGSGTGNSVYVETHTVSTNANGLLTLEIGAGNVQQGTFVDIDWANGPYFLKTETDPNGGTNYSITSTQQLLSVPYALYSKESGNGFSGDYNDLTNTPEIPTIPTNVSTFNNDAGYITGYTETDPLFNAWDKNYNDLINKPSIPVVPTNVSAFANDVPYLTSFTEQQVLTISNDTIFLTGGSFVKLPPAVVGFSGDYNDLTNRPTIPTNVSSLTNDAGYISNFTETDPQFNAWDKNYNDLTNKPVLFDGNYNSLTNQPIIPTVPTNVSAFSNDVGYLTSYTETDPQFSAWDKNYNDLTNKPVLFDGDYNSLTNQPIIPTVPTNVSAFSNDVGYLTSYTETDPQFNAWDKNYNDLTNKPELFSGDYNDLTNTPTIPEGANNAVLTIKKNGITVGNFTANASNDVVINMTVPTATSQLDNDAGFVSAGQCNNVDICMLLETISDLQNQVAQMQARMDSMASDIAAMRVYAPTVSTAHITDVTISTAMCGGAVTDDGGAEVTAYGICWSTSINPTIADNHTTNGSGMDSFVSNIANLSEGVTYYVRAYATNSAGTSYGDNVSFTASTLPCGNTTVSDHEGNVYNTVQIGNQCWTKENMRCTTSPSTGTVILDANPTAPSYVGKKAYYVYENPAYINTFGLLYNWNAAVDTFNTSFGETSTESHSYNAVDAIFTSNRRGICPEGWHVPSDADWTQLMEYVYSQSQYHCSGCSGNYQNSYIPCIAKSLASNTGWTPSHVMGDCDVLYSPSSTNNLTGFNAFPAGMYNNGNSGQSMHACFWCSTQINGIFTPIWTLNGSDEVGGVERLPGQNYKSIGASVRCLRNSGFSSWNASSMDEVPTVTTTASFFDVGNASATCGGVVNASGNGVTDVGICWNTTGSPTLSDNHTNEGSHTGSFTSILTDLEGCTTYYVRAYAINSEGTTYGEEVSFTTENGSICGIPTVFTASATEITTSTVVCGGDVTDAGQTAVTARGLCWSTSIDPTIADSHTTDNSGIGSFVSNISGLASGTTYYIRAYATNSAGTAYGNQIRVTTSPFQCGSGTVTDHEGNIYNTVLIGDQCWTKENMRCTTSPSTGTTIVDPSPTHFSYSGKKAYYVHGDSTLTPTHGLLYNWNAAVDTFNTAFGETSGETGNSNAVSVIFNSNRRGICPEGWHVPSDSEWKQLTDYVRAQNQYYCQGCSDNSTNSNYVMCIAKSLASTTGWSDYNVGGCTVNNNPSSNNATGFSALAADCYESGSNYLWNNPSVGNNAIFWSTTHYFDERKFCRIISTNANYVLKSSYEITQGLSVRCLLDEAVTGNCEQVVTPTVKTSYAVNVTETTALSGGVVVNDGGFPVTARGLCWSIFPNPTESDSHSNNGCDTGTFVTQITGLTPGTKYYVRAYASNALGTAYGGQVIVETNVPTPQFTCGTTAVFDHEGNVYNTLQIGNQCWTKENMRCMTSPSTGTMLLETEPTGEVSCTGKKAYYANNRPSTVVKYGLLYNWNAAVDVYNEDFGETSDNGDNSNLVNIVFDGHRRGICPQGWHVPSITEWQQMTNYVSSQSQFICGYNSSYIAKALAAYGWNAGGSNSCGLDINQEANNATGFSIVPADQYPDESLFGCHAHLWSSSQYDGYTSNPEWMAYIISLYHGSPEVEIGNGINGRLHKGIGISVRCLRD